MQAWKDLLNKVINSTQYREPSGEPTVALFNQTITVPMSPFPAVTLKRLEFGQVVAELAAFLHGETTLQGFHRWGCKIWDANAKNSPHATKEPGHIYGANWVKWLKDDGTLLNQLDALVESLDSRPHDRRHILQSYNPGRTDACLPACHMSAQFYETNGQLNCTVTMRSCDLFLGLPFDIASYAVLTYLVCKSLKTKVFVPGDLTFNICDAHIYVNHFDAVREVLNREPYSPPLLQYSNYVAAHGNLKNFTPNDVKLVGYKHHDPVPAPMNLHEETL